MLGIAVTLVFGGVALGWWITGLGFVVGIFGVSAGAALGAIAALIADRVSTRGTRSVMVERGAVIAEPEPTPAPEEASAPEAAPDPDEAAGTTRA